MKLKGNKGEWSEFYAFVKLLSRGKLYAADENANRVDDIFFPILKILRTEEKGQKKEYVIRSEDRAVEIHWHTDVIGEVSHVELVKMAARLYRAITEGKEAAFGIDGADAMMNTLSCTKLKAPSTDKTDITMQLHDIHTGYAPICGFSIKSEIGRAPTLLNASHATNFVFEVRYLTDEQAKAINAIDTQNKIMDRIDRIREYGVVQYARMTNDNFAGNLMLIDSHMEDILAKLLLDFYQNNISKCKELIARLEKENPLNYSRQGGYEYKFKKFLCSVALGMMPTKVWDGHDEANGGYVIVKENGDVVAYHIYNRDAFETYLLNNTRLERASTTRHGYASVYKESDGKMYINLNLQIRFI